MSLKHNRYILFTLSLVYVSVIVLITSYYASDRHRSYRLAGASSWGSTPHEHYGTQEILTEKKCELDVEELLPREKDKLDIEELLPGEKNELDVEELPGGVDEFGVENMTEESETESIRVKLSRTIGNVELDVLNLNVKLTLKSMSDVPFGENRLIHKIQRAQRHPGYKCVIRITKYCANRCDHYVNANHSREWKKFHCAFAEPCQLETRFVGHLTSEIMDSSDIIFFISSLHDGLQLKRLIDARLPGQLWTLHSRESPHHDKEYAPPGLTGNPFNLSMTYARDTDIHFPVCNVMKQKVRPPRLPKKTKLIAWMASNCHLLSWRRGEFAKELQNHLAVDTYGRCGDMGSLSNDQARKVLPKYKFYLALENSECRDYITEKLWSTCLLQGIVPIVYGAKREDYEQTLPKNSFIYVEDFSNMSAFVDYIHALDSDNAQYKKYFDWRTDGHVNCLSDRRFSMLSPEINMCYLVRKLIRLYIHPETSWQNNTPDFASWWRGQCLDPNIEKKVLGFNVH